MSEQWRPVPGWEGLYEVSDLGRVRSLDRVVARGRGAQIRGIVLKPQRISDSGPMHVRLHDGTSGKTVRVHHIVLAAFIGPRPKGMYGLHNNGDATDNRLCNLRWGTPSDNNYDAVKHGTHPWASKTECPAGHEYSDQNTACGKRSDGRTFRVCKICASVNSARYRARRRQRRKAGRI